MQSLSTWISLEVYQILFKKRCEGNTYSHRFQDIVVRSMSILRPVQ